MTTYVPHSPFFQTLTNKSSYSVLRAIVPAYYDGPNAKHHVVDDMECRIRVHDLMVFWGANGNTRIVELLHVLFSMGMVEHVYMVKEDKGVLTMLLHARALDDIKPSMYNSENKKINISCCQSQYFRIGTGELLKDKLVAFELRQKAIVKELNTITHNILGPKCQVQLGFVSEDFFGYTGLVNGFENHLGHDAVTFLTLLKNKQLGTRFVHIKEGVVEGNQPASIAC